MCIWQNLEFDKFWPELLKTRIVRIPYGGFSQIRSHITPMLMCCRDEVMWHEPAASIVWSWAQAARHWQTDKALGYEKLLFREQILEASKIEAPLGLGTRLVTELTVDLELRGCGRGMVYDKLMSGVATTCMLAQLRLVILDICNNMPIDNEFELD